MNILRSIIASAAIALIPVSAHAAFPGTNANADSYNISVSKVELCRNSACSSPFVVGSGTKDFDIASASAGAEVGSFIDITGIPLFQSWSHVRVTLSTTITIAGSGNDDGDNACRTNSANTASSHTALGVASSGAGTGTGQTFVVPNVLGLGGGTAPTKSDYDGYNLTKSDGASTMTMLYPLSTPYICTGVMPRIAVEFNTQDTVKFYDASGAGGVACSVYALPPTVTITISDP